MTGLPPELLDAVVAEPDDDAPRLACADWLDENGRPDDARFVRVQVALARRDEGKPSRKEAAALAAEEWRLLERHRARWLDDGVGADADWAASIGYRRGFADGLWVYAHQVPARSPAEAFPLLAGLPTLRAITIGPTLPRAALDALPALPLLESLTLVLDGVTTHRATLARLADFPRLESIALFRPQPDGTRTDSLSDAERQQIRAIRSARLRDAPAESLPAALRPFAQIRQTFGGRLAVGFRHMDPLQRDAAVCGRLPGLAAADVSLTEVPAWLSEHSDLRGLRLCWLTSFDAAPLAGLHNLRWVSLFDATLSAVEWDAVAGWLESLPALTALSLEPSRWDGSQELIDRVTRLPRLRSLHFRGRPELTFAAGSLVEFSGPPALRPGAAAGLRGYQRRPAEPLTLPASVWWTDGPPGAVPLAPAEAAGPVTIRPPDWFRRLPTPAPQGDSEPLGLWLEWGDGDPLDRAVPAGPTRLFLERLPLRLKADEARTYLRGPAGTLARPRHWGAEARRVAPSGVAFREASGTCPFMVHTRFLWHGKRHTLRLSCESTGSRVLPASLAARAVAESLAGDIDA